MRALEALRNQVRRVNAIIPNHYTTAFINIWLRRSCRATSSQRQQRATAAPRQKRNQGLITSTVRSSALCGVPHKADYVEYPIMYSICSDSAVDRVNTG